MKENRRLRLFLHFVTGGALVLAAVFIDYALEREMTFGKEQMALLLVGLALMVIGVVPLPRPVSRLFMNLCLAMLSLEFTAAAVEGLGRLSGVDFAKQQEAFHRTPPYFRQPTVPSGEAFFRRFGPEVWTGQVLNTRATQLNVKPNPYRDEPMVTVTYNENGFRKPSDLDEWEITVTGDSFTELGYLPDEELFTSLLADALKVGVLNLGTSYTGPLTQLSYLRDYGLSKRTSQVVTVFFEGNDLEDLDKDYKALTRFRQSGRREYREITKQSSVFKALDIALTRKTPATFVDAFFPSSHGTVPLTMTYTPPGRSKLRSTTLAQLDFFFQSYAAFGKQHGVTLWIAYMPCKARVLHGQVSFAESANERIRSWIPSDLPDVVGELAAKYGVGFIDLTPALTAETRRTRELLFNSLFDSHLTREGSRVVAGVLRSTLGPALTVTSKPPSIEATLRTRD